MKLRWLQLPIFTIFGFLTVALNSRAETGLDVTSLVDITDVSKVAQDPMLLTAEISMGPKVTRIDFANSADGNCQQSIYTNSLPEIQPGKIARSLVNPQRCLLQNMKKEMDQATFSQNISCDPSRDQRIKKLNLRKK